MMDVKQIREEFPLLVQNEGIIYLDNAATSQKPACVLEAERDFYEKYNANLLRGLYELSEKATQCYEEARRTVQRFIKAGRPEEDHFYKKCDREPESCSVQSKRSCCYRRATKLW